MAQIIDKIIRQSQAPNSTNVMWDNGEQLFINRNGSWQSVGGSSNGGSDVVVKVVDFDLLLDNPEYAKEIYNFAKSSYLNGVAYECVTTDYGAVVPPVMAGSIVSLAIYYDAEEDLLTILNVLEEPSGTCMVMLAFLGPSTDYIPVFENLLDEEDAIVVINTPINISANIGDINQFSLIYASVLSTLIKTPTFQNADYNCSLYSGVSASEDNGYTVSFFGFTEDNKIIKIVIDIFTGETLSSTLFDLNSLITTA